jgi:hypothetical protein
MVFLEVLGVSDAVVLVVGEAEAGYKTKRSAVEQIQNEVQYLSHSQIRSRLDLAILSICHQLLQLMYQPHKGA